MPAFTSIAAGVTAASALAGTGMSVAQAAQGPGKAGPPQIQQPNPVNMSGGQSGVAPTFKGDDDLEFDPIGVPGGGGWMGRPQGGWPGQGG